MSRASGQAGVRAPGLGAARWPWGGRGVRGAALRFGVAGVAALVAARVHERDDPGVLCPLRRFTGVPCPFCGSTTMFMQAGAGHWGAAVTANPFMLVAVVGLLLYPVLGAGLPGRWAGLPGWARWTLGAAAFCASWLWQLHRFSLL
ncbi:MAG TPA: DUF2752 domain-containing protein [Actinocrinis sp.]|nr:DUF2752 domain-containing protein [Actinocrinis sp.]